jgi:hypothetical protein
VQDRLEQERANIVTVVPVMPGNEEQPTSSIEKRNIREDRDQFACLGRMRWIAIGVALLVTFAIAVMLAIFIRPGPMPSPSPTPSPTATDVDNATSLQDLN